MRKNNRLSIGVWSVDNGSNTGTGRKDVTDLVDFEIAQRGKRGAVSDAQDLRRRETRLSQQVGSEERQHGRQSRSHHGNNKSTHFFPQMT